MQYAQAQADLLEYAGRALYGRRWTYPLGQALGVTASTFRSWTHGKGEVPLEVWREILQLVEAKLRELRATSHLLKNHIDQVRLANAARQIRRVLGDNDPDDKE
jgi:hypothetical protein